MQSTNHLLDRLDEAAFERITSSMNFVSLEQGQTLARTHERVSRVYFPHGGIISCVVELPGGGAISTGMIGRDGQWGGSQALDDNVSIHGVVVQVAGSASFIDATRLKQIIRELPEFLMALLRYEQFFTAQVQQTAACNAVHSVEARFCKWLLRMYDLVGSEFPVTQEFMAQMMGVRRTSVTVIAGRFQKTGILSYRRGHLRIEDVPALETRACECIQETRLHHRLLFEPSIAER